MTASSTSSAALCLIVWCLACHQPAPAPAAVVPESLPDVAPAPGRAPAVAVADASAAPRALDLERVARSNAGALFAIDAARLLRYTAGHWTPIALEGADARDLVAARGYAWILARGTGENAGHALVLRTTTGDDMRVVASPRLGADSDPRTLAVVQNDDFWIGGENPSLVHSMAGHLETVATAEPRVISVRTFRDESTFAIHPSHRATVIRWGEHTTLDLDDDYLDAIADADDAAFTVHVHGEVGRGRPGHEWAVLASATPFVPRLVALLPDGRPVAVGAGGPFAVWEHHAWRTVEAAIPREPVAIAPGSPVLVVGRRGEVVEVRPGHAGPQDEADGR